MVKAADALAQAGHEVRVVSASYIPWAREADVHLRQQAHRAWIWDAIDLNYSSPAGAFARVSTGLQQRWAVRRAKHLGVVSCPLPVAATVFNRSYKYLLRAVLQEPADLYYGGGGGGLAVAAAAARRVGVPYALDLEDFHTGEQPPDAFMTSVVERVERDILPGAAFLTTASEAIARAYEEKYRVKPIAINNTFPLPPGAPPPPVADDSGSLKLYWFSQTIGPNRGLEDVVKAAGLAGVPIELHLRGSPIVAYLEQFRSDAARLAPLMKLVIHAPAPPDEMIRLCYGYDVGLALEQPDPRRRNTDLALSNKVFTYMLGGLALAMTNTGGQRALAARLATAAVRYDPGDVEVLAQGLLRWATDRPALERAKRAAWDAASARWHWEHDEERGALLKAVAATV
jgi:glycosyltransferase involved in cell wall biosynthesis